MLHEFCHEAAAGLLCNRVTGIEVSWDEGGLASYRVRDDRVKLVRTVVLPAGYIGSKLTCCALLVSCAFSVAAQLCGLLLCATTIVLGVAAACGKAASAKERRRRLGLSSLFGLLSGSLATASFALEGDGAGWPLDARRSILLLVK